MVIDGSEMRVINIATDEYSVWRVKKRRLRLYMTNWELTSILRCGFVYFRLKILIYVKTGVNFLLPHLPKTKQAFLN